MMQYIRGARAAASLRASVPRRAQSTSLTAEELESRYLLGNYSSDAVRISRGLVFERGEGSHLFASDGRAYLDFFGGIAVNALGHSDAGVARVLAAQALKIQHTSNIVHTMEPLLLAKELVESTRHFDKAFLCNSGTEANEAALKFAKKVALIVAIKEAGVEAKGAAMPAWTPRCKGSPPTSCATEGGLCACWPQVANNDIARGVKNEVIAFKGAFHGRTMGALACTHKPAIRQPFGPFPADVRFARFNNIDDVLLQWTHKVGAVIVEPTQGEGGIYPAERGFMRALKDLCVDRGALLIVDEVQCGLGRTGRLWAHEAYDVAPDIMTMAKPLAAGFPIGAVLMTDAVAASIVPGDHGTTFGGNPLASAVARHVLGRLADPEFLKTTRARGAQLLAGARALAEKYPGVISAVRGTTDSGLFVGIDLIPPFKALQEEAVKRGLLLISAGENTVRLAPALNISEADVASGLAIMDASLAAAYKK